MHQFYLNLYQFPKLSITIIQKCEKVLRVLFNFYITVVIPAFLLSPRNQL